ncbi:mitochondrial inner membrane protein OXA1-like [Heracleum sosnowskyi]|uniref:Mitochondrial inner membrane protein OXA1-like n=1 Tax=Heracleum sosnowskyi TaxID=360622 RepID=A0AAD8I3W4_9APIA|nr:mitochondrial inner membrane protein OXA1-like [Heracleum sosnowskyi]
MAFGRSLITRAKLFNHHKFTPSFQYIHHHHNDNTQEDHSETLNPQFSRQNRSFTTTGVFNPTFRHSESSYSFNSVLNGSILARNMSTSSSSAAIEDETGKVEYMSDVAGVLSDGSVDVATQQGVQVVSEVAVAAADSYFPVAALQYLIDYIHTYTGLPWWGSIAATTVLIRWLALPVMINQLKTTSKLTLMRPKLEEIKQEMQDRGMSPTAVKEGQQQMSQLFKEYGVTPWTPLKGLLIQGPVFLSFFFAIQNMVEKVPSFKEGGAFWFVDLTTPDSFYIFPVLTALTFWITVECNMQEGMEGNPAGATMKKVMRVFALITVPITMSFPKAIFCYWITSNLFSLFYGLVIRAPNVKKLLGIPNIPVARVTTAQPAFSFTEALKKYVQAQQRQSPPPSNPSNTTSVPTQTAKPANQNKPAVSSVLSQRIRSLENQVKGRKKGKKK